MTFNESLPFLINDNDCWVMLTWVRDGNTKVYCECIVEDATDNMNHMQNMDNAIDNMTVGFVGGANLSAPLEADKDGQHLHVVECSYSSSDYDINISSKEDEYEQEEEVKMSMNNNKK